MYKTSVNTVKCFTSNFPCRTGLLASETLVYSDPMRHQNVLQHESKCSPILQWWAAWCSASSAERSVRLLRWMRDHGEMHHAAGQSGVHCSNWAEEDPSHRWHRKARENSVRATENWRSALCVCKPINVHFSWQRQRHLLISWCERRGVAFTTNTLMACTFGTSQWSLTPVNSYCPTFPTNSGLVTDSGHWKAGVTWSSWSGPTNSDS